MMQASRTAFSIQLLAFIAVIGGVLAEPIVAPGSAAAAQQREEPCKDKLRLLFDAGPVDPDWFNPEFLKLVSPVQVERIIARLKTDLGAPKEVQVDDGSGFLLFENARVPLRIGLDDTQRIEMLWFGSAQLQNISLGDLARKLENAAVGELSLLVTVDGKPVLDERSESVMAVASAFKLIVLRAYEDAVKSAEIRRDQIVTLEDEDRSLPSGTMQVLSAGTPVTLEALAQLMIKISDNTATDTLMRILGRERLERLSPRNVPFLSTRELFQLIAPEARAIRARYTTEGVQERLQILSELKSEPLPEAVQLGRKATWREVEWHLTAKEICELLQSLKEVPALDGSSQPLFDGMNWPRIGYKGGFEYGVINLSAIGTTPQGREVCAVVSANGDAPQSEGRIAPLFADLLRATEIEHSQ